MKIDLGPGSLKKLEGPPNTLSSINQLHTPSKTSHHLGPAIFSHTSRSIEFKYASQKMENVLLAIYFLRLDGAQFLKI